VSARDAKDRSALGRRIWTGADTEHFVILNEGGGLFGKISITSHLSANG
jgi:hypothetical protein